MKWFLFVCLIPFALLGDRWDITQPAEVSKYRDNNYQYRDVSPNHYQNENGEPQAENIVRGPASLVPMKKIFEEPKPFIVSNKFSIIATKNNFMPEVIKVPFQTEVEITLMTSELESCFVVSDLGIRKGLKKDGIYKVIIPAQMEAKEYEYHCAIHNIFGKIVVEGPGNLEEK